MGFLTPGYPACSSTKVRWWILRLRQKVTTASWILCSRVCLSLDVLDDRQTSSPKRLDNVTGYVKPKIQGYGGAVELIGVHDLISDMKRYQSQSVMRQDSPHLPEDRPELR